MGYDKRIGHEFLRPGPGWGGSCFPKDVQALLYIAREAGYDFDLLAGVVSVNEEQFDRIGRQDRVDLAGGSLEGRTVGVWGLTFKAGTDDLRESPSLHIIDRLLARGARVRAYDPAVKGPLAQIPDLEVVADAYAAVRGCRRAGRAHRVGRVQVGRPRQAGRPHGRALHRRRPQPARPVGHHPPRLHLPGIGRRLMARVVITGGAGFLGSHLCDRFLERGDEVVALDNLSTGRGGATSSTSSADPASPSSSRT